MGRFRDVVIKNLYAKSGNICAFPGCNCNLTISGSNISQVAHIISERSNGPRHDPNYGDYDCEENLILLCSIHHKIVDDNEEMYTVDSLLGMKACHEEYIRSLLNKNNINDKVIKDFLGVVHSNNIRNIIETVDYTAPFSVGVFSDIECAIESFNKLLSGSDIPNCEVAIENDIVHFKGMLEEILSHVSIRGQITTDGNSFVPNSHKIESGQMNNLYN
jgi:hypothetical protein